MQLDGDGKPTPSRELACIKILGEISVHSIEAFTQMLPQPSAVAADGFRGSLFCALGHAVTAALREVLLVVPLREAQDEGKGVTEEWEMKDGKGLENEPRLALCAMCHLPTIRAVESRGQNKFHEVVNEGTIRLSKNSSASQVPGQ